MGDSLYYFKRHVIFLAVAVLFTAVFVIYARPWFWRVFGVVIYAAAAVHSVGSPSALSLFSPRRSQSLLS